jgi:hypothetical protein
VTAPTDATRVDPMPIDQIRALPGIFPVWPTGSAALGGSPAGLSRGATYEMAKNGTYVVPVLTQGRRRVVRRMDVMAYLGLTDGEAIGVAAPIASVESIPATTPIKK